MIIDVLDILKDDKDILEFIKTNKYKVRYINMIDYIVKKHMFTISEIANSLDIEKEIINFYLLNDISTNDLEKTIKDKLLYIYRQANLLSSISKFEDIILFEKQYIINIKHEKNLFYNKLLKKELVYHRIDNNRLILLEEYDVTLSFIDLMKPQYKDNSINQEFIEINARELDLLKTINLKEISDKLILNNKLYDWQILEDDEFEYTLISQGLKEDKGYKHIIQINMFQEYITTKFIYSEFDIFNIYNLLAINTFNSMDLSDIRAYIDSSNDINTNGRLIISRSIDMDDSMTFDNYLEEVIQSLDITNDLIFKLSLDLLMKSLV